MSMSERRARRVSALGLNTRGECRGTSQMPKLMDKNAETIWRHEPATRGRDRAKADPSCEHCHGVGQHRMWTGFGFDVKTGIRVDEWDSFDCACVVRAAHEPVPWIEHKNRKWERISRCA